MFYGVWVIEFVVDLKVEEWKVFGCFDVFL